MRSSVSSSNWVDHISLCTCSSKHPYSPDSRSILINHTAVAQTETTKMKAQLTFKCSCMKGCHWRIFFTHLSVFFGLLTPRSHKRGQVQTHTCNVYICVAAVIRFRTKTHLYPITVISIKPSSSTSDCVIWVVLGIEIRQKNNDYHIKGWRFEQFWLRHAVHLNWWLCWLFKCSLGLNLGVSPWNQGWDRHYLKKWYLLSPKLQWFLFYSSQRKPSANTLMT